jgi:hypothetical protein
VENVRTILDHVRLSCTIHSTVMRPALDEVDVRK